ncbi:MAG: family N-acetyltransferase [Nocardioides sp.]|jgi:hypothetical protein|nr:family N-acetyltransferase [Nocardioides sp.]
MGAAARAVEPPRRSPQIRNAHRLEGPYGEPMTTDTSTDASADATFKVRPLTAETWPAFDALVERHGGIFGGCWCIWFHPDGPEHGQGAEANRELKKR